MQQEEPLYKRVPKDGTHPAKSRRVPGAISGAALDDETNKPSGSSDFMPVEGLTEEEYKRKQAQAVFAAKVAEIIMDWAHDRTMNWLESTAIPALKYRLIPAAKDKVIEWGESAIIAVGDRIFDTQSSRDSTKIAEKGKLASQKRSIFQTKAETLLMQESDRAKNSHSEHETISQEQYEQLVSLTKIHALLLAADIRRLSTVCVSEETDETRRIERQQELERLTSKDVMNSIQLLLSEENQSLLDEATQKILAEFKNGYFVVNEEKVPVGIFTPAVTEKRAVIEGATAGTNQPHE